MTEERPGRFLIRPKIRGGAFLDGGASPPPLASSPGVNGTGHGCGHRTGTRCEERREEVPIRLQNAD